MAWAPPIFATSFVLQETQIWLYIRASAFDEEKEIVPSGPIRPLGAFGSSWRLGGSLLGLSRFRQELLRLGARRSKLHDLRCCHPIVQAPTVFAKDEEWVEQSEHEADAGDVRGDRDR